MLHAPWHCRNAVQANSIVQHFCCCCCCCKRHCLRIVNKSKFIQLQWKSSCIYVHKKNVHLTFTTVIRNMMKKYAESFYYVNLCDSLAFINMRHFIITICKTTKYEKIFSHSEFRFVNQKKRKEKEEQRKKSSSSFIKCHINV